MYTFSSTSARNNLSIEAKVNDRIIWAEGAFRTVYTGTYTEGPRRGQNCVAKWFKTGPVYEEVFCAKDVRAIDKALVCDSLVCLALDMPASYCVFLTIPNLKPAR